MFTQLESNDCEVVTRRVAIALAAGIVFAAAAPFGCSNRKRSERSEDSRLAAESSTQKRRGSEDDERTRRAASCALSDRRDGTRCTGDERSDDNGRRALEAPIDLSLDPSARRGRIEVTLSFVAERDFSGATTRFVIPEGVELLRGRKEVEFGGVRAGTRRSTSVLLQVPETGSFELAAGVDVELGPSVQLHRGDVVALGEPRKERAPGRTIETPGAGRNIRLSPTVPASDSADVE